MFISSQRSRFQATITLNLIPHSSLPTPHFQSISAIMTSRLIPRPRLILRSSPFIRSIRSFSASSRWRTDGVYQELTAMRTRTPFIEAFREQQKGLVKAPISTENVERDLSPKSMSDSYHRVVGSKHMTSKFQH
jgi:hypothetical protein